MKPIWFQSYEPGVPHTINPDVYPSLNALIAAAFSEYKDSPALSNMNKIVTYAQLEEQSRYFASFLRNKLDFVKGDRFAILMPNLLQYPVAIIGVLRAGGIVVNFNFLLSPDDIASQIRDSQAVGLLVSENLAHIVSKAIVNTAIKYVIVTKISDVFAQPKALFVDFYLKYIKRRIPSWKFESYYKYKDVLKIGATLPFVEEQVSNKDVAFLQYTGGTTGLPKGAMLTQRNIVAMVEQLKTWCNSALDPGNDVVIAVFPFFHIAATINLFLFMHVGALNVLITNPFDIKSFINDMKRNKFTVFSAVNGIYKILLNEPELTKVDFSRLKIAIASGMAVQQSIEMRWKQLTGKTFLEGYGLTEASLGVAVNPTNIQVTNGTVGLPLPSTEVSIRNDNGDELGIDKPGELWVRGPQIMLGYWNRDAETSKALTPDGWFKTGDIAIIDEKGYVKLIDRKKDVILILGFNVYPSEVELVISMMPGIKEVAVVDAYDNEEGEYVKAFVVSSDPSITEKAVIDYCSQYLLYYKVPRVVEFRDSLPKSAVGKVLRRALRYENSNPL